MTNHWNDIQYSDAILVMGGNPAENHPISMKYVTKAMQKGGKLISVDPRFTRTSAKADVYAPLRSGTDIAFVGGLINYALENNLYQEEYVKHYTNASYIVHDDYDFDPEEGIFSGYDDKSRSYDRSTWTFKKDEAGNIEKDMTLQHPRSVFQVMKKHYSRYDIDTVSNITGTSKDKFLQVAEAFCATGRPDKVGTIMYAMGATQHTTGSENIRSFAIIQLLLGNIGLPGGGINAMRGEANVQGSTDFGLLFHLMPGYLSAPTAAEKHSTLAAYLETETPETGYWSNTPKFMVSLLKAHFGDHATKANDFLYDYYPKGSRNYSHISLFESMYKEEIKGLISWGQNPVVGGPNAEIERQALAKLDWYACIDIFETETATFWTEKAGANPAEIDTEVFLLPACGPFEKAGTISNSGRWMQYRWKAIEPKNDSRSDSWIAHNLYKRLKKMYEADNSQVAAPFKALSWDFDGEGDYPDMDKVAKEINGYDLTTGKLLPGFGALKDDGTTTSGNWIYSGFYPEEGKNLAQRRDNKDTGMHNYLNWSYAWPMNRRIIYNRASADLQGKPWSKEKSVIWWDEAENKWTGYDVPDFVATKAPTDEGGDDPFIMRPNGVGELFTNGLNDGPFPEHYEPYESPVEEKDSFSNNQLNPVVKIWDGEHNPKGENKQFPIVATTYRVSEHWQSGAMTRSQPWLVELMPHMFVEISEELAEEKGIKTKDEVIVNSARGEIKAYALITKRLKPMIIHGEKVHTLGMPWHYGYKGLATGSIANVLTPHIGDANTMIPEYKAFLCDIRRAE